MDRRVGPPTTPPQWTSGPPGRSAGRARLAGCPSRAHLGAFRPGRGASRRAPSWSVQCLGSVDCSAGLSCRRGPWVHRCASAVGCRSGGWLPSRSRGFASGMERGSISSTSSSVGFLTGAAPAASAVVSRSAASARLAGTAKAALAAAGPRAEAPAGPAGIGAEGAASGKEAGAVAGAAASAGAAGGEGGPWAGLVPLRGPPRKAEIVGKVLRQAFRALFGRSNRIRRLLLLPLSPADYPRPFPPRRQTRLPPPGKARRFSPPRREPGRAGRSRPRRAAAFLEEPVRDPGGAGPRRPIRHHRLRVLLRRCADGHGIPRRRPCDDARQGRDAKARGISEIVGGFADVPVGEVATGMRRSLSEDGRWRVKATTREQHRRRDGEQRIGGARARARWFARPCRSASARLLRASPSGAGGPH